jgi:molybdate transport system regulatory protein
MFDRSTNTFCGKVVNIQRTILLTELRITLPSDLEFVSLVTTESFDRLGVSMDDLVYCSIKPTEILVGKSDTFPRTSSRNCFPGTITELNNHGVTGEVAGSLLDGTQVRAGVTVESMRRLDLKVDDDVYFSFKSFSVILAAL